ncbi:hypothetical protein [Phragmitibacter flavus]|uniref:hypothetical protein n=1 Tax=Phragmitibacter flavus TaxID=2576071 RepID=UPI001408A2B5|nr:hypothetical protein [Phragmitibacter flavus]
MGTVLEIEKAIEQLPREQVAELREWFDGYAGMMTASSSVFALYDEEEGEGQQWED